MQVFLRVAVENYLW